MKKPALLILVAGAGLTAGSQQLTLIKDINPGSTGSNVSFLTQISNHLFFAANNGVHGMELWKSDGTEAGTVLVKDINPGAASSSMGYLVNVNGVLFFVANNGVNGTELWKSDGTAEGTVMVKDIRPGSMGSSTSGLVNVNGTLFFAANDGVNGTELWKSDGSEAGTVMVKDINPLSGSGYPRPMAAISNILFFAADDGVNGSELWKSDGTATGTVLVKDIWSGADGGNPSAMVSSGNTVFFSANNGSTGIELWKSDGTAAGTVMVKNVRPGSGGSDPFGLRSINGTLFFSANNGVNGSELWKSDGTTAGTLLVKDIWPGTQSGAVGNFSKLINQLLFTGNDGVSGNKTWQSDGSVDGTTVATIVPGSGMVQELVETDTHIFASLSEAATGKELWGAGFSTVLPIKLLDFRGRLLNNDGLIEWKTEQEMNALSFTVERSMDGNSFTEAGKLAAANISGIHRYSFTDRNIVSTGAPVVYYRLKQTSIENLFEYSATIALHISREKNKAEIYPNPAVNDLNLAMNISQGGRVRYQVVDITGKTIKRGEKLLSSGSSDIPINTASLPAGRYFMLVQAGDAFSTRLQFIKQ